MSKVSALVKKLGALLARTEAGIAQAHEVGDALVDRADEVAQVRHEDMERQRKMLATETDPHRLRGIEDLYLATAVDRDRARRVGRYERYEQAARKASAREIGPSLLGPTE